MRRIRDLIVMYHSVGSDVKPAVVGSNPIHLDRFKRQMLLFDAAGYRFASIRELDARIDNSDRVFITSDDGTSDWATNVLPWCEVNSIPTHTGIISGPLRDKPTYPLAHLVQLLLASKTNEELTRLCESLQAKLTSTELDFVNQTYNYETDQNRRVIKGALNFILPQNVAMEQLSPFMSEADFTNMTIRFQNLEFYRNFSYATLGNHTENHTALGQDFLMYFQHEVEPCKEFLKDHPNNIGDIFTLPLKPRANAEKSAFYELLQKNGFKHCLTSFAGIWDGQSFEIPRIDAQDVEGILEAYGLA